MQNFLEENFNKNEIAQIYLTIIQKMAHTSVNVKQVEESKLISNIY